MPPPGMGAQYPPFPGAPMPPYPGAPMNMPFPPNLPPQGFRPPFPPMGLPGMPSPIGMPTFGPPGGYPGSPAGMAPPPNVAAPVNILAPQDGVMWPDAEASPVSLIKKFQVRSNRYLIIHFCDPPGRETCSTTAIPLLVSTSFQWAFAIPCTGSTASRFRSDERNPFSFWCRSFCFQSPR